MNIAEYIDHTLLKPNTTAEMLKKHCQEAMEYNFYSVCIQPCWIEYAKQILKSSDIKICTVISFPMGSDFPNVKAYAAQEAIKMGADEIDMVINLSAASDQRWQNIYAETVAVKRAIGNKILKVILETGYLEPETIKELSAVVANAGADFIKTSTGLGPRGASIEDIKIIRSAVTKEIKIKAAGGISDAKTALAMIGAGADRIGTSSGIKIVEQLLY